MIIKKINQKVGSLEIIDFYTWKELSGDVFRPPIKNPMLLSSLIGNGFQLFSTISLTLLLEVFDFLDKNKKVNIFNVGITFFLFNGFTFRIYIC